MINGVFKFSLAAFVLSQCFAVLTIVSCRQEHSPENQVEIELDTKTTEAQLDDVISRIREVVGGEPVILVSRLGGSCIITVGEISDATTLVAELESRGLSLIELKPQSYRLEKNRNGVSP